MGYESILIVPAILRLTLLCASMEFTKSDSDINCKPQMFIVYLPLHDFFYFGHLLRNFGSGLI